ncbi:MAG: nitrate reductase molybdenum cofactor assembly chaperone, partial [Acidimicrobiales bacterium]
VELCDDLSALSLLDAQREYVATFDLQRRCCLYLSYYLNGDTRRRGMALWRFQEAYRLAGQCVVPGELPDYLPAVLEFASSGDEMAIQLLNEHRAGILVLLEALGEMHSPYARVVGAIDLLLPPESRAAEEARRLVVDGPPSELVGIDAPDAFNPYGVEISRDDDAAQAPVAQAVTIRTRERA